jgi:NTP pyrophosphatase (non-canonical NTP hydrolase)
MKEDLLKRINYFGIENQKRKFSEEAEELRDAIVEYEALKEYVGGARTKQLKKHIAEEIADNIALLKQFQLYYEISNDMIMDYLEFKNERTDQRVKVGYYDRES